MPKILLGFRNPEVSRIYEKIPECSGDKSLLF